MDISLHLTDGDRLVAEVVQVDTSAWINFETVDSLGVRRNEFVIFFHGDENKTRMKIIADAINGAFPKPPIVEDHTPEPVDAHGERYPVLRGAAS